MNKAFENLIVLLATSFSLTACQKAENVSFEKKMAIDTSNVNVEGCDDVGYFNVSFNLEDFATVEDEPNIKKAQIAMLFAANICLYSRVKIDDTKYFVDTYSGSTNLYNYFQFQDVEEYFTEATVDKNDIAKVQLGHHLVKHDKKNYDIIFCSIIDSSITETWVSNLDVGYDDESYYSKTGQHSEWTDKENHKGFDVTANRCVGLIEKYISDKKSGKTPQILYIFGHSRGGAVGNLVAKKLTDKDVNAVAYTMASPLTTTSQNYNNSKYNHIYNYVNDVDTITVLPSTEWGFKRYGKDIHFDVRNCLESFKEYVGEDVPNYNNSNLVNRLLSSICQNRSDAYVFDERFTLATSKALADETAVNDYILEQKRRFSGVYTPLQEFLKFDVTTNADNKYIVKVISCGALISHMLGLALAEYGLSNAISSVAMQYYSILTVYTKAAGISNPLSLKDEFNMKATCYAHFYQSYVAYFFL